MSTVFIDATAGRHPSELARYAYDPFDDQIEVERLARLYSERGRRVRVYARGLYVKQWRHKEALILYECLDGQPTPDYQ